MKLHTLKASPETLRLFYSSTHIRNVMLLVAFKTQRTSQPSPRANRDVHSLDYQILLTHFPALLESDDLENGQAWDREPVIGTLASAPDTQTTLLALVEKTPDYLQHLWRVWPAVHERLIHWSALAEREREVVLLGLLVLITICQSGDVLDLGQPFASGIRSEFMFAGLPRVPSSPATAPPRELSVVELWKQEIADLASRVAQLPSTPELTATAPLRFHLDRLDAIAQRAVEESGMSAQEFAARVRKQVEWQEATWLTPALENLEQIWEQVQVERAGRSPRQVREEVFATLTRLLNIHTQRFTDRTRIAQEMADIEVRMPRDLDGLRKAREQLRPLRKQLDEHDMECGNLEQEILSLLSGPPQTLPTVVATPNPSSASWEADPAPKPTPNINVQAAPTEPAAQSDSNAPALGNPIEPALQIAAHSPVLSIEPAPVVIDTEPAPALQGTSSAAHREYHRVFVYEDESGRELTVRSPFTLDDEFQMAGFRGTFKADPPEATHVFTISLVFGSAAAGLEQASQALASLHQIGYSGTSAYQMLSVPSHQTHSLESLRRCTRRWAEDTLSGPTEPRSRLLLIPMPWLPEDPSMHAEILEHVYTLRPASTHNALRAVLLFDPSASWQWLSSTDSAIFEASTVNIHLGPWSNTALHALLWDLKLMMDSPQQIEYVQQQTGGWWTLLQTFIHSAQEVACTDDLTRVLTRDRDWLTTLEPAAAQLALSRFGMSDVPHAREIFADLIHSQIHTEFDVAVLRVLLDEKPQYAPVPCEVLLAWGLRLGLLSRVGGADSEQFRIDPTVAALLERHR
jgi:hypothetical protein